MKEKEFNILNNDEQEIIDLFDEIKETRDRDERSVLIKLTRDKIDLFKSNGNKFDKISNKLKEKAQKIIESGKGSLNCCKE